MNSNSLENGLLLMMTTESNFSNAKKLANKILSMKLASCINFTRCESMYWWEDELKEDFEIQLLIKTKEDLVDELFNVIKNNHSYKVPELICFKAMAGKDYIRWVFGATN
ncbi:MULTISPECIES: divalent-cation tolerance protein CutA [Prochlorococcus]|uniref:Divalent-cation tolerance protein CutA n=1 Tax=Prochlorococcus marinus (strain SARG / CCMP1375 / SS120) TaxID=167539 RepID=Q7VD79_PROMA|nr:MULTISPECIES: divalent-cation tolerance protein CutA [Prochlorococcus]AAP99549.1 Uncharacterized protein Pro_0504 [Prochlorococcus marinus subsp. marinus str. CCMP1375]KGG11178.1 Periplasmic divalent cation tolerance protein CutA [Prochlorococcus marinus str. LG]KGG21516.1 Periplasmic divalent cation tolerance protein CutA [Prochlorococcus marinus str. SS2]KGG23139.1 Periplasmic divalent cation tolerance protein CutA [Prochlorococcus marinus str. SS35]KGG33850.1 Periplasmic divalent cation 